MPDLSVHIPDSIRTSLVNINDDIKIDINYGKDVDKAIFNMIIVFNFDNIGIKQFSYTSFKFKIWDIASAFDRDISDQFLLRVSLYDPEFLMPNYVTFNLNLNYPPKVKKIKLKWL